jgi:hypothetical protein
MRKKLRKLSFLLEKYLELFRIIPFDMTSVTNLQNSYTLKKNILKWEFQIQPAGSANEKKVENELSFLLDEYLKLFRERGFESEKKETWEEFISSSNEQITQEYIDALEKKRKNIDKIKTEEELDLLNMQVDEETRKYVEKLRRQRQQKTQEKTAN